MKTKPYEIVFALYKYEKKYEPEEAHETMWADITALQQILLANEYTFITREEECGIIIIEFEHDNAVEDWGSIQPMWITVDEAEQVSAIRAEMDTESWKLP